MNDEIVRRILDACPVCKGAGVFDDVYQEHGDPLPVIVTRRTCYYCRWVRAVLEPES